MAERPLRLLVVGLSWPPQTFIANLLRGLASAGIVLTLAVDRRRSANWQSWPNIEWLALPPRRGPAWRRLWRLAGQGTRAWLRAPQEARQLTSQVGAASGVGRLRRWQRFLPLAGRPWDVLYFPWNSAAVDYAPLLDLDRPTLISCRGSQINVAPHNPARKEFREGLRQTLGHAAAGHCVTHAIQKEAIAFGLDPGRAHVIYPAVDSDFFQPGPGDGARASVPLHLITVGNLHWVKGHEYALAALRQLLARGVAATLEIIGSGPDRQRLLYTIDDLDLNQWVTLSGRIAPAEVRARLQAADVFILTSVSEGLSNAALEAMACGLPVVTTDCGGMAEAIEDGVEGFVVPIRAPEPMAERLDLLARDTSLRRRLGAAGRQRVLRQFQLSQHLEQFASLIRATAAAAMSTAGT